MKASTMFNLPEFWYAKMQGTEFSVSLIEIFVVYPPTWKPI